MKRPDREIWECSYILFEHWRLRWCKSQSRSLRQMSAQTVCPEMETEFDKTRPISDSHIYFKKHQYLLINPDNFDHD